MCNLKYKMHVSLIRLKQKGSFNSQVNVLKKKNLHGNFVDTFSDASNISFTSFASGRVNGVLQTKSILLERINEKKKGIKNK